MRHQVIHSNSNTSKIGLESDRKSQTISQYSAYNIVVRGHYNPISQDKPETGNSKSQPLYTNDGESIVLE